MRSPRRNRMPRFEPTLWLTQAFIAIFRVYARGVEVFGSGRNRNRARLFREQMAELSDVSRAAQEKMKQGDLEQGFALLENVMERGSDHEERQSIRESRLDLQAMREESEALKQIRSQAGNDTETAIAEYRTYIKDHPGSHLAFTYLGSALRDVGRLEESLAAHQQVLQIEEHAGRASSVVTHLAIGDVLKEMGRLDDAFAAYQAIIGGGGSGSISEIFHGHAYLHLGDVLKLQGRETEAHAAWKQAVKLDQTGKIRGEVAKRRKA